MTPYIELMIATPRNMDILRKRAGEPIAAKGVFAYSPVTGEKCSASPGDYWDRPADKPLLDSVGGPMVLCTVTELVNPV